MPKSMFDIIKKQNGERFAKAIRNYDNGIFDIPNLDQIVKYAGREAEPIMNYLVSLKNVQIEEMSVHRDPIELLSLAGYDAYVADTLEKQNAIKKYYAEGEELCTFRDPSRYKDYYIINAVRKDVDKIKRSENPQREDKYGTSVISIQVLKTGGFISIKNRYNHTVPQPDNTLNSNPDNIIPGLADAIKHYFDVDFAAQKVKLADGYVLINDQICKYNQEIDNIYSGSDFYIRRDEIHELNKGQKWMLGNGLVLDVSDKTVNSFAPEDNTSVQMAQFLQDMIHDKKIRVELTKDGTYSFFANDVHFLDVLNGMITFIHAPYAKVLRLCDTKLHGDADFSQAKILSLVSTDLSECTNVKYNPEAVAVSIGDKTILSGDVDFSHVNYISPSYRLALDFSHVHSFKIPEKHRFIRAHIHNANAQLTDLDLHDIKNLQFHNCDLSNANITWNPTSVEFDNVKGLTGVLNLEHAEEVRISNSDLSHVSNIKTNPNTKLFHISKTQGIKGNLNLNNASSVQLYCVDCADINEIKVGNGHVEILDCQNLHGDLDLSHAEFARIQETDLSRVRNFRLPEKVADSFYKIVASHGVFDVSHSSNKTLRFYNADLSRVTQLYVPKHLKLLTFHSAQMPSDGLTLPGEISDLDCNYADFSNSKNFIISGHVENLKLSFAVGLHGDLDFTNVDNLDLSFTDLSKVRNIKFNPHGYVTGLTPKNKLRFALINGTKKIQQGLSKVKQKVIKNEMRKM